MGRNSVKPWRIPKATDSNQLKVFLFCEKKALANPELS
jgi:hypothetical protein